MLRNAATSGLFWALACIWLIYPGTRIPHIKGEAYNETSAYPFIYTDYLPTEFLINGIVSCLLTVVNVICIFITAIIVLKIKEVSAPYTASPDLKRFWETDIRTVRKTNRSTMRHRKGGAGAGGVSFRDKLLSGYQGLEENRSPEMDSVLEQALKEAEDDVTFKKVKRMSYSSNAAGELTQRLAKLAGLNKPQDSSAVGMTGSTGSRVGSRMNSVRNSKKVDLKALDKLVTNLLEQQSMSASSAAQADSAPRKSSMKLNRWRPTSRSAHSFNITEGSTNYASENSGGTYTNTGGIDMQHMPTIMESTVTVNNQQQHMTKNNNEMLPSSSSLPHSQRTSWSSSLERTPSAVRNVLRNMTTGGGGGSNSEENLNLTQNYIA